LLQARFGAQWTERVQLPEGDFYNFVGTDVDYRERIHFAVLRNDYLSIRELAMEHCISTESVFAFNVTRPISIISLNCSNRLFFVNEMEFTLSEFEV
jgi:hypothetical protein